jgi:hypothetical protein
MTSFWVWVSAGCALSALFGFSAVRFGARKLGGGPWLLEEPARAAPQLPRPAVFTLPAVDLGVPPALVEVPPAPELTEPPAEPPPAKAAQAVHAPAPAPTSDRPDATKLALWARQIKAGERKMSIATDGCRVTWNRTCKHGHPSWLVHLGYLKRHQLPRHNPR